MAKARKQKNEELQQQQRKTEESLAGGNVLHQKLCLSIDMSNRRIFGHTEMKVLFPKSGILGLHADNMTIVSILVDGQPAEFEYFEHYRNVQDQRWDSVSSIDSAADAASASYLSALEREVLPNLLIPCRKVTASGGDRGCPPNGLSAPINLSDDPMHFANGGRDDAEQKNAIVVRINYYLEGAEAGVRFGDNVLCTENQLRRAHSWFPCIDSNSQRCCYDLEFTVDMDFVAVSSGTLLYQILTNDTPQRKIYVYKLSVPVSPGWISLVVAPFEIIPDSHYSFISHMCLQEKLPMLHNTVGFFHTAFSHYEDYLSMPFPFGSYKQVFVPPELSASSVTLGASMSVISSDVLFDEKIIDQIIDTRIKIAYSLARQWFGGYVVAEAPMDEWLVDGLAGFLTDLYIRRFLGNNEARYRRYKANRSVCEVDVSSATSLSSSESDLFGTHSIGFYGKIRSWKAIAVVQMLEKQMGPESFRKILQLIVSRSQDGSSSCRTLSTKEFRQLANKVGNLERPFLKEFFLRWVESCGCPVLRLGLSYIKRKNVIELGVMRNSTSLSTPSVNENENRESDTGWPGMMSIRVHEVDGVYDHPILPMSGESLQLLEIQLHSRLASKRFQKPKKGTKHDGSDDNSDILSVHDTQACMDSPLLWIRIDPEMEYLSEIDFHQPIQMWINQLEKDKDVVAQSEAIQILQTFPQLSFSVVNALNNILNDSKAFWRVRIEAAYALACMTSEETDWAGLHHLIKFYKSRRFDADIGLPKPNNFQDVPEYFVLEDIPHALSMIRTTDKKSPREAVEFISHLLKHNDNNGNQYSDVYWVSVLVQSIGGLQFGKENISFLPSLLKRIDLLLQFDRLMPSHNGILTISCVRSLTQVALKMPVSVPFDQVSDFIRSFQNFERRPSKVRVEANKSLLDLEFNKKNLDAALSLFLNFLKEEQSFRGQVKLARHVMLLCHSNIASSDCIKIPTLVALLRFLTCRKAFNNVFLRHYLFCILQIIAGRPPTLSGVRRVHPHPVVDTLPLDELKIRTSIIRARIFGQQESQLDDTVQNDVSLPVLEPQGSNVNNTEKSYALQDVEPAKETDNVSCSNERRVLKIKVKQHSVSGKADGTDNLTQTSRGRGHEENDMGPCSSVSVDAPPKPPTNNTQNAGQRAVEEVNSFREPESRITASVGSAKLMNSDDELVKELQCTADSRNASFPEVGLSPAASRDGREANENTSAFPGQSFQRIEENKTPASDGGESRRKEKKEKHKDKKRKREDKDKSRRDDPEYLERKRLKKEKKRIEKEMAKAKKDAGKSIVEQKPIEVSQSKEPPAANLRTSEETISGAQISQQSVDRKPSTKVKIKIKPRIPGNI